MTTLQAGCRYQKPLRKRSSAGSCSRGNPVGRARSRAVDLESVHFQPLPGARVVAVEDRHIVLCSHLVDGIEEAQKDLLHADVLLAVGAQQNVLALLEPEAGVDIAGLDLSEVLMQHLRHGEPVTCVRSFGSPVSAR